MSSVVSSLGVAIVTGASKGIGRAIALRLAKDGYDVGINDLPAAEESLDTLRKEIFTLGRRPFVSVGDVSVPKNVENMISSVVDNLGQLDVMVANAGIAKAGPLIDTKISDWHELFSINAFGVFLSYQYAAKQMIKQGTGGRIIGASSIAGKRGELHLGAYSATKFAVRGLTQVAAQEWGRHGIRVNAYCPGYTETELLRNLWKADENLPGILAELRESCPVGYNGTPEDVAEVVSYLASKESHFMTGQSIAVCGGRCPT